jgi:type II secretory pathway pseudopilin PulG
MRGQLSLEMLIVIVVVLGLAVLLASALFRNANKAAEKLDEKTGAILNVSDSSARGAAGDYCTQDADCSSGACSSVSKCL